MSGTCTKSIKLSDFFVEDISLDGKLIAMSLHKNFAINFLNLLIVSFHSFINLMMSVKYPTKGLSRRHLIRPSGLEPYHLNCFTSASNEIIIGNYMLKPNPGIRTV